MRQPIYSKQLRARCQRNDDACRTAKNEDLRDYVAFAECTAEHS